MISTAMDLRTASTTALVNAVKTGNMEAYGQLFKRFERLVFAIGFRKLRNYTATQDLIQEVFLQALLKINQLRKPEKFGCWLHSITRRMAINQLIRGDPAILIEPEAMRLHPVDNKTPEIILMKKQRRQAVQRGLQSLKELDRATLISFHIHGLKLQEMAEVFEAPLGTIKRRLHVARKRLAKEVALIDK